MKKLIYLVCIIAALLITSCNSYMRDDTSTDGMVVTNISSGLSEGYKYCYKITSSGGAIIYSTYILSNKEFNVGQKITICLEKDTKTSETIFDTITQVRDNQLKKADSIFNGKNN
jgi:major membrane immunogen (membrane-anchored lipoprotein)